MADLGRLLQAFSAIVRETLPNLDYFGVYLYEVFSWNESAQTADLKPVGNQKLPQVTGVQARLPAMQVKLAPGDQVLVGFQDGNSSQPFIAQLSYSSSYATPLNAARQGDMVACGGTGTLAMLIPLPPNSSPTVLPNVPYLISFGSATFPPLPAPQGMLPGIVTTGSTFVKIK